MRIRMNERIATRSVFFIAGLATSAWAVMVPFAKLNTGANEALLGILLLCLGGGAIISMPLAGPLSSRYGCRKIIGYAVMIIILSMPFLTLANSPVTLGFLLLIFGIGVGLTDCAMNIQAILVEKNAGTPLMSGFHGMYSVGGIAGAGLMTGLLTFGLNILASSLVVSLIIFMLLMVCFSRLLPYASPAEGPAFAFPKGEVLLFGAICFIVFLAEGTVLDWSAVYLVEVRQIADSQAGLGFTFFALAMTVGRLSGDVIIRRFGSLHIVVSGAVLAFGGFCLIIFSTSLIALLIGYLCIGAGCANIVPVMFSQVGKQTSMPQMVAVPAVTTMGYIGVLAGPAMIGFIAHHSSLPHAFIFVAALMLIVLMLSVALNRTIKLHQEF
ncbi:MFS transporter [Salmonella enterica]|uniref:MFS transporter n=4 Tax=Salmonella enterica TaxID=28901 RepID=A0A763AS19_SALER|nr:MFS transporter [Salmonella enterica subsp. enterica serovar Durham]EAA3084867.1 MFS transporter [Salmonella enterica subsp. enterica serovar Telelkebir]EAA5580849.1 MFS transporter [Salmonella enterica subsp. enterica serovar Glostrup]EAO0066055.1 MFS transporter [Salmonella enterica]EBV2735925.1 MFS transporter [Salmonella enterica subsp. enterica serovar Stourbridge]EBV2940900.1 MFS transporter [Salmonella enterica subsp. enterica serovar Woodhull]EBY3118193.1 MFS transporter [Salmonell